MNQEIKVRLATTKDLRIIQGFQVEMEHSIEENPMPDEDGRKGVDYILSKSPLHGFYLVAKINKEIIGYLESLEKMFNFEHTQALAKSTSCGDKLDDDDLDDY